MSQTHPSQASSPKPQASSPLPCVFLDRDGTVCKESGYINHPERMELLPGAAGAIRRLNQHGALVIVVTNQAGVARGYFTEEVLAKIHGRMEDLLAKCAAKLDAIYYAPNHRDAKIERYKFEDDLRKPGIGMIHKACEKFPIELSRSYVVGDKNTDVEMAHRAGLKGVFVLTGYGLGEYEFQRDTWKTQPDHIAKDLREAVNWILKDLKKNRG